MPKKITNSKKSNNNSIEDSIKLETKDSLKFYDKLLDEENQVETVDDVVEDNTNVHVKEKELTQEEYVLKQLREILFGDEIRKTENLSQNLNRVIHDVGDIKEVTLDELGFESKLHPYIENHTLFLRDNFADLFGDSIRHTVQRQIRESKDEFIEAMYPIVIPMVKRYIAKEFKLLNERLERTANQIFKFSFWKTKFRGLITGVDHTDMFLQELYQSKIEDIFIIQKETGLLIGKFIIEDSESDRDIVAGALTAIKGFVESALGKTSVELEKIDYGENAILLHNYHKFYFAVMCSGTVGHYFVQEINEKILNFAEEFLFEIPDVIDSKVFKQNSQQLQKYF